MREDKEFLKELLTAPSPSGQEEKALEVWKKFMTSIGRVKECYSDKMGNSAFKIGQGKTKILLSGHIDQVNARVSLIHDSGLISIYYTGGIDNRVLPGSRVWVLLDSGDLVPGAIIKGPMHLDDKDKWPEDHRDMSQIKLDVGAESKEEVEELGIHPGNLVVYNAPVDIEWGKNRICSPSLDDKIAVYVNAMVMKKLRLSYDSVAPKLPAWASKYEVIALAAVQEETGLRGATVAAKNIGADISIDTDVSFGTDDEMSGPKEKLGDIRLGKGPVISFGTDKSIRLNRVLMEVAKENGIQYQTEASTAGGTNTDAIQLSSADCETAHVALPNWEMHGTNEMCDWRDIDACIDLLYQTIISEKL